MNKRLFDRIGRLELGEELCWRTEVLLDLLLFFFFPLGYNRATVVCIVELLDFLSPCIVLLSRVLNLFFDFSGISFGRKVAFYFGSPFSLRSLNGLELEYHETT